MIPILYPKDATKTDTTTTNGRGSLLECIKCEVTEERNGIYELSMQYPITGSLFTEITEGALIKAKPNDKSTPQLFRIYKSGAPLKGIVTYSAEHISYDLTGLPIANLVTENTNAETAMQRALSLCPLPHSFNAYSDITTPNSTAVSKPTSIRAAFGGTAGGVLDTYGGEFEFDNYNVHLWKNRGANNGIILRYGKNITDINQERNIANCYTHIYPYAVKTTSEKAADGTTTEKEIVLTLPESVLPLINPADVGHTRVRIVNFSDDLDDKEDLNETTLRTLAKKYTEETELHAPEINITLSFVNLAQTEDYKDMALLEAVGLCDIINVYFEKLNITAHAKVIKTVYDALKEKLIKIEVGNVKANFVNTVKSFKRSIEKAKKVVGPQGKSAYETWLANGNTGTETAFLASLKGTDGKDGTNGKDGVNGKSAYETWLDNGNAGTETAFLSSLKGADGKDGTNGKDGVNGKSAYDVWLANGNTGSEADFLVSLKGDTGATGKGIKKMEYDSAGNLVVTYTDGSTQTIEKPSTDDPDGGGDSGGNSGSGDSGDSGNSGNNSGNSGSGSGSGSDDTDYTVIEGVTVENGEITGDGQDFNGAIEIPSTYYGDEVTGIAESGFAGTSVQKAKIAYGIQSIGSYAFAGCSDLTSVTIPSSVTYVGSAVFANDDSLENIYWQCSYEHFTSLGLASDWFEGLPEGCTIWFYDDVSITIGEL